MPATPFLAVCFPNMKHSYKGTLTLEELMMGDSVEQYRAEQGPLMGGM